MKALKHNDFFDDNLLEEVKKANFIYYDSIGFLLSLLSKLFISNYKKNFDKKIKFWDSLIWISRIIDFITLRSIGKSLLVVIKK